MSTANQQEKPPRFNRKTLFNRAMKKKWEEVKTEYKKDPINAGKAKLTKSEETILHIAVSSYNKDQPNASKKLVMELVEFIPKVERVKILMSKDGKGNTPLHLAAALGSVGICECIAGEGKELSNNGNDKGETPLFLGAHHGQTEAYTKLHELYNEDKDEKPDESVCRRKDGDTILHSAISGEYFELANRIIIDYQNLVNAVNEEGYSPLYFLARKPNLFESSSNLQLFDQFMYRCAIVHETFEKTSPSKGDDTCYPAANYKTCGNLLSLPGAAFKLVFGLEKDCGKRRQERMDHETYLDNYAEYQYQNQPEMATTETVEKKHETLTEGKNAKETPFLLAAKMGITEMVNKILEEFPVAIQDVDSNEKNALLLAVESRQIEVFHLLLEKKPPESVLYQVDNEGNSAVHLAANFRINNRGGFQVLHCRCNGKSSGIRYTYEPLCKLISSSNTIKKQKIYELQALIATVAFATSSTVPGGVNPESGNPIFEGQPAFLVFSIGSVVALCFSVTALVFFLAILTSRCKQKDFRSDLPQKLLFGLSSLFTSIAAILISFCAGHFFLLRDQLENAAYPIYTATCLPITFYAFAQLPLYFDLVWSINREVPVRPQGFLTLASAQPLSLPSCFEKDEVVPRGQIGRFCHLIVRNPDLFFCVVHVMLNSIRL
ncbi:OLC1v1019207C1 [Oldenlandia corymbosa var. corymbosa]|uniref:OLC1v1019207C1 n=1 Tax=Oldenlandia corymbosa var. corymbosa TaxID=529605 RepID=A0AAV1EDD7_OLDCO|nr:OLC1v1019207C1 [Oldenlandia corymbosa var. corymbosa]